MPIFSYIALNSSGKYIRSNLKAKTKRGVQKQLEKDGFLIINIKKISVGWSTKLGTLSTVSRLDKIFFTRHLQTLLESGIALDQALKISAEQMTNKKFKTVLVDIYNEVVKGQNLHNALSRHTSYFSPFYINLIKVGERSGSLDDVLKHLLEQQEQDYELITKTRGAMIYPLVIITAAIVIVSLMLAFVIPNITSILTEYNVELPLQTKILIFLSDTLYNYGILIALAFLLMIILLKKIIKTKKGREIWDGLKLNIPFFKNIVIEFNLAKFSRAMSTLLKSGISIDQALELSSTICGNIYYQKSIKSCIPVIQKGIPLTEVLSGFPNLYPPITTRMLEIGEKTG